MKKLTVIEDEKERLKCFEELEKKLGTLKLNARGMTEEEKRTFIDREKSTFSNYHYCDERGFGFSLNQNDNPGKAKGKHYVIRFIKLGREKNYIFHNKVAHKTGVHRQSVFAKSDNGDTYLVDIAHSNAKFRQVVNKIGEDEKKSLLRLCSIKNEDGTNLNDNGIIVCQINSGDCIDQIVKTVSVFSGNSHYLDKNTGSGKNNSKGAPDGKKTKNNKPGNPYSPLNNILYGPPGTGKTYRTVEEAVKICDYPDFKEGKDRSKIKKRYDKLVNEGRIQFITFHQSMAYEDFIEGIKPETGGKEDGQIRYYVKSGIFKKLAKDAEDNLEKRYVLIIDEINRGNIAEIFGELITLIEDDKRIGKEEALKVKLPYSDDDFGVPENLYIIGTMNTADRSVEALDTALRRRFSFTEMPPDYEIVEEKQKKIQNFDIDLAKLLTTINDRIEKLSGPDYRIGHSYFLSVNSIEGLRAVFFDKIIPLLKEYFYGDFGKIGLVLGDDFVEKIGNKSKFANFKAYDDKEMLEEVPVYRIRNIESRDFEEAVKGILK